MHSEAMTPLHANKCPVCGLLFVRKCSALAWGYAYDGKPCCSYKCMREAEKADREREEEPKLTRSERSEKREAMYAEACRMFREGVKPAQIGARFGVSDSTIYNILTKRGERSRMIRGKEEPKVTDEKITTADEEVRQLTEQLEKQTALTDAAVALMMAWKERYELAERTRHINAELNAKEAAYFEALRAAKPPKEG